MDSTTSPTTFADIHPHIIQSHILPRVDAPSLSIAATASPYIQTLCADQNLWSDTCNSTWPSTTHPRVHHVISTFPTGHLSFFQDSSPALTHVNRRRSLQPDSTHHSWPSELISAVDIRYKNDIVYSGVEFTDTGGDFMSSELGIVLKNDPGISLSIDLKVEEVVDADDPIIAHLKESVTLTWILIDPIQKRAVDLSSIKAVMGWVTEDIHLRYAMFLPGAGCDRDEMVECRIELRLVVGKEGVGLHVRKAMLQLHHHHHHRVQEQEQGASGKEFLVITRRALLGKVETSRAKSGWVSHVDGTYIRKGILQLASFLFYSFVILGIYKII